jgi:hypothetical protein
MKGPSAQENFDLWKSFSAERKQDTRGTKQDTHGEPENIGRNTLFGASCRFAVRVLDSVGNGESSPPKRSERAREKIP